MSSRTHDFVQIWRTTYAPTKNAAFALRCSRGLVKKVTSFLVYSCNLRSVSLQKLWTCRRAWTKILKIMRRTDKMVYKNLHIRGEVVRSQQKTLEKPFFFLCERIDFRSRMHDYYEIGSLHEWISEHANFDDEHKPHHLQSSKNALLEYRQAYLTQLRMTTVLRYSLFAQIFHICKKIYKCISAHL